MPSKAEFLEVDKTFFSVNVEDPSGLNKLKFALLPSLISEVFILNLCFPRVRRI